MPTIHAPIVDETIMARFKIESSPHGKKTPLHNNKYGNESNTSCNS